MRFNKATKKFLAVLCSLAMIISSITVGNLTAKAADVAEIVVTATLNKNYTIDASWTNPEGTAKTRYYINQEDEDHYARNSAAGWTWSVNNPTEIRTALDGVDAAHNDSSINVKNGGTFTIIVVAYNADDEVIGRGTSNEVVSEGLINKDMKAFVERYDNDGMFAFIKWSTVSKATKYVVYDEDGKNVAESTGDWAQVKLPGMNKDYTYTVKAYDTDGNEISDITNNEVTARIDGEEYNPENEGFELFEVGSEQEIGNNWSALIKNSSKVYCKTVESGFTYINFDNNNEWENGQGNIKFTYKATGLEANKTYKFTVNVNGKARSDVADADKEGKAKDFALTCDDVNWYNNVTDEKTDSFVITEKVIANEDGEAEVNVLAGITGYKTEVTFTNAQFTEYIEETTTEVSETTTESQETSTEEVSETESTVTPGEDDSEYASLDYKDVGFNDNNEFDQGLKGCQYAVVKGQIVVCQFQNAGFAELYMAVGGMGAGNFKATVNGKDVTKTEGTGVFMNPASDFLTYKYNVVEISSDDGTATVIILNPNKVGTYKPETPVETTTEVTETTTEVTETTTESTETTTESTETTTESTETTTESTETTTEKPEPVEITMDQKFDTDGDHKLGGYTIYVGQSWNGSTAVAGVDAEDADHIKVQQKTSNWGEAWGLQVKKEFSGLVPGAKYSISWKINAASNDGKVLVTNNQTQIALVGGEQVLTGEFTAAEDGTGEFVVGMGWVGLANPIEFFAPEITKISEPETTTEVTETTTEVTETTTESQETTTEAPETTTKAQEETTTTPSTTKADATTKATDATTKADDTTKATDATTKAVETTTLVTPTTTAPTTTVAPAKVTVKKVAIKKATKKKSAKKASIVLKKVSGAAGYQVKVSTSKKFAKKTTVTVNTKSVKVTVKKLKTGKTYYVKARAYKKVSGSKVYGKWSKVIKIANK